MWEFAVGSALAVSCLSLSNFHAFQEDRPPKTPSMDPEVPVVASSSSSDIMAGSSGPTAHVEVSEGRNFPSGLT